MIVIDDSTYTIDDDSDGDIDDTITHTFGYWL